MLRHVHSVVHEQSDALLPERITNRLVQRAASKHLFGVFSMCLFRVSIEDLRHP